MKSKTNHKKQTLGNENGNSIILFSMLLVSYGNNVSFKEIFTYSAEIRQISSLTLCVKQMCDDFKCESVINFQENWLSYEKVHLLTRQLCLPQVPFYLLEQQTFTAQSWAKEIQDEVEYHTIFPGLAVELSRQISKQTIIGLGFSGVAV